MNVRVKARRTYSAEAGNAIVLSTENITIEAAVVGPDTRWRDEPNKAATTAGPMAAYKPYCGGMPAMVANAIPCGKTMIAPISPAIISALPVARSNSGHHARSGNRLDSRWVKSADNKLYPSKTRYERIARPDANSDSRDRVDSHSLNHNNAITTSFNATPSHV